MDGRKEGSILLFYVAILVVFFSSYTDGQQTPTQTCQSFTTWQTYYSSWYVMYPQYAYRGMYPFGLYFCDQNATTGELGNGFNPGITFPFNFYGTVYRSFWVSQNGYILLNQTTTPGYTNLGSSNIVQLPNQIYPYGLDLPMISPFYADFNYGSGYGPAAISWRVLNPQGTSGSNQTIQQGMLSQLTKDIRAATLGSMWFEAQWGMIITYYNVSTNTNPPCPQSSSTTQQTTDSCLRNTFQVALATDGTNSYAIYNYFNISWIEGVQYSGCNPLGGNQNSTSCIPAQMGFNAGYARGFTSLPYAGTDQQIDMDSLSGTNVTGRWIYQISGDVIHHGGCTNDSSLGSSGSWPLTINPLFGPMFGGNVVNVSGPCFVKSQNTTIKCRFGSVVTTGYYWGDMMQAMCVQPMLYEVGPITLSVSTDGGQNYYFSANYTVIQQERVPELGVTVFNTNNNWLKPTTMTLTWNPANLTTEWGNVVTIQLIGYSQKKWQVLYTFEFEQENTGTYTFTYNNNMCYNQNTHKICAYYALGAFRVSLSNWQWDYNNPISMWSSPVPLAWFNVDQVSSNMGSGWSHDNCRNWYKNNTFQMNHLAACPCTLNQSYVDFGSFIPTPDCNLNNYNQPGGCPRNQGAMACYESVNISSAGSNTRCCYNKYGNLLYSEDSINGSISQASDPSGMYPYNTSPYIPSISHWENDLLPYYYCCVWENNPYDCYNIFMVSRPTQDCKNYNVPGHATVYGDPHFITMDGTAFPFNAWGEFWLLQISNAQVAGGTVTFSLQGRFQQPLNQTWGQIRATVMSAAAMQLNGGTIVTVMSNLYGSQERLLVYVNSDLLNFTSPSQWWQQYPDFFVVNNDQSGAYSNFSILFRIGIGVNIAWNTGVMEMFVTIPAEFKGATGGLFGYWNGNPQDDLMPRGSTSNPIGSTDPQTVYYSFGLTWIVQSSETIFTYAYRAQLNYNYYRNTNWFVPWFNMTVPPGSPASTSAVQNICYGDQACQYDYYVTGNQTVAAATHAITMWDAQIRQMGSTQYSCGWFPAPDTTKEMPVSYMAGSQVTITGCYSGFMMTGSNIKTFTCQLSGSTAVWSSQPNFFCEYLNGQPPPAVQAAIAVPITVCCTVGIILLIIFICRWRKRKERREGRREKRAERREERHLDSAIPPEPQMEMETKKEVIDGALLNSTKPTYNNIVTGALSESYIDRNSRSSTPSKMSVHTGVSNVSNGRAALGGEMIAPPMVAPPRSRTPSQGYPAYGPGTPTQGVSRTITYTTDPGRAKGPELTLTVQAQGPVPYQYPVVGRQSPYDPNRGADNYYSRRYAPTPTSMHGDDSEV